MDSTGKTHRLFFALWPSDELREQIGRAVMPALEGRPARPVRPANLHITLAFLGSITADRFPAVLDAGDQIDGEPFDLTIDHLESWRAAHVACLTLSPLPPALTTLVERLRFSLLPRQVEADQKPFRAHVTVARDWRERRLDERIGPFIWRVQEFVLVESRPGRAGSEYQIVRTWPLVRRDRA
jgi:RNA 2',3'-cyclic 3'-phosphodiesterase